MITNLQLELFEALLDIISVFAERDLLHAVRDHRGDGEGAARGEQQVQVQLQAARHRQELLQLHLRQVSEGSIT